MIHLKFYSNLANTTDLRNIKKVNDTKIFTGKKKRNEDVFQKVNNNNIVWPDDHYTKFA